MSVNQAFPYSYIDNGDGQGINEATGNRIHMKTNAKLLQFHWQASEYFGANPEYGVILAADGTTILAQDAMWMDDIANLYCDFASPATLSSGSDYYVATTNFGAADYGFTFYPDTGISPIPISGTYFNWTGSIWSGSTWYFGVGWDYFFGIADITLELVTITTSPKQWSLSPIRIRFGKEDNNRFIRGIR